MFLGYWHEQQALNVNYVLIITINVGWRTKGLLWNLNKSLQEILSCAKARWLLAHTHKKNKTKPAYRPNTGPSLFEIKLALNRIRPPNPDTRLKKNKKQGSSATKRRIPIPNNEVGTQKLIWCRTNNLLSCVYVVIVKKWNCVLNSTLLNYSICGPQRETDVKVPQVLMVCMKKEEAAASTVTLEG